MLHPYPGSSASLVPLIEELAAHYTVVAPDLPGQGESEPPAVDHAPSIADYADAVAAMLQVLDLGRVAVYGTDVGGLVALELERRWPRGVSCVVVDRIGAFADGRMRPREGDHAFVDLSPSWDGSHLVAAWAMCRDAHLFRPWFRRSADARLSGDLPDAEELHDGFVEFLRAGVDHRAIVDAARDFDVVGSLGGASSPTLVLASRSDPAPGEGSWSTGILPSSVGELARSIRSFDDDERGPARVSSRPVPVPGSLRRTYVETSRGRLLVRQSSGEGTPMVMLHASPTSGAMLEPLAVRLAEGRPVVLFDNPGNGDSTALPGEPSVPDLARAVLDGLDALGVGDFHVFGSHTGAHIAIELALAAPRRVGSLVLDGILVLDEQTAAVRLSRYAPRIVPQAYGEHVLWAWNYLRDQSLFWPWFDKDRPEARRETAPPDPAVVHARVVELLKGARTYHHQYHAVFRHPVAERLALLALPVLIGTGPGDPLGAMTQGAAALVDRCRTARLSLADPEGLTGTVEAFFGDVEKGVSR